MSRTSRIAGDAVAAVLADRGRSLLMILGVGAGVALLSGVIVAAQGARAQTRALVAKHGLDMIMIRAGGDVQVFAPTADRGTASLFAEDAHAIASSVPNIRIISPVQNKRGIPVVADDGSLVTRAFGVGPDWMDVRGWDVAAGAFINAQDMAAMNRVVVIGDQVARGLFPQGGAVGRTVRIAGDPYIVKGIFVPMGVDAGGDNWDDRVVVPFTTSSRRLFNRPHLEQIVIRVSDARRVPETAARIRDLLRVRHNIGAGEPDDFFVREPADVAGASLETARTVTTLVGTLAVVALIAAAMLVMNLMLGGVTRRAHEIGVRRAAGARSSDIARQFLIEALIVAIAGGLLGAVIGVAATAALAAAGVTPGRVTWVPFAAALVSCIAIAVAAGVQPARRAARVDPAQSLRQRPT